MPVAAYLRIPRHRDEKRAGVSRVQGSARRHVRGGDSLLHGPVPAGGIALSVFDADFTFVNERLAKFYGVESVTGEDWRRIDGLRQQGRGGILGLSATLAKQSGAARTSPILRGN